MIEKKPFLKSIDGKILQYKSIWISDIHLGTKGCQADMVLEFIKYTRSENLYLVGDIVDGWALKNKWYWPQQHNDVIQKILRKARHGTRVFYLAGNHDEILRKFIPINPQDCRDVQAISGCWSYKMFSVFAKYTKV